MSFPYTEPDIRARIDEIDGQIQKMTANWETLVDYRIGPKTVDKTTALAALRSERDALLKRLARLPAEEINHYDDPDL